MYDSKNNFYLPLPESMRGNILIRNNLAGTGWLVCDSGNGSIYCELRVVDPAEQEETDATLHYERIANIGNQQLQARIVTPYSGLTIESIVNNVVLLGLE